MAETFSLLKYPQLLYTWLTSPEFIAAATAAFAAKAGEEVEPVSAGTTGVTIFPEPSNGIQDDGNGGTTVNGKDIKEISDEDIQKTLDSLRARNRTLESRAAGYAAEAKTTHYTDARRKSAYNAGQSAKRSVDKNFDAIAKIILEQKRRKGVTA